MWSVHPPLKDPRTKYATITTNALLIYLYTTCGKVDIDSLTKNEGRMKSPPSHIESLYKQLAEGKESASQGGDTISYSQLVRYGYNNILVTCLFTTNCEKWRKMRPANQTWLKFQDFFTIAVKDPSMQCQRRSTLHQMYKRYLTRDCQNTLSNELVLPSRW